MNDAILTALFECPQLSWERAELPLMVPIRTSAATYESREVLALRLRAIVAGVPVEGFGECSPLPGWSTETISEVELALRGLARNLPAQKGLCLAPEHLNAALGNLASMPTLRFGLELAMLDALARQKSVPLAKLFADEAPIDLTYGVRLQSTHALDPPAITAGRVRVSIGESTRAAKLKVGLDPLETDVERIRLVREKCPNAAIRLDANRAFSMEQALTFAEAVAPFNIDFLEEPVACESVEEFAELSQKSAVPIAADESCSPPSFARELIAARAVRALVLKPMSLGGLLPTLTLIKLAENAGLRIVISNLIESAIGRRAAAHLVAGNPQLIALDGSHGLITGNWLKQDLAPERDKNLGGTLRLDDAPGLGFVPTPFAPGWEAT
ncbi:o-succinylbenzoate synthase [Bradymonadaceae bacterium TMQ3]|uniref:o-succinylbenzoate synthase n=1 Tax=Lujinxingia sediminis TaxID=2480984 RepID=A0ABY0CY55_9DELT|nr:o-succinylbenzoate synthase [Lujinxingia sediminis]RDV39137.1 o-succinylbenzoate synthase [Bradymonadaceae bacterium TMQ3]RVU48818.1 o-succinylbenzoate synthase [Lujinxingia sediminis]TXC78111.1 o-succinylbenzoate synthase [Bradymonadales bacterium TMQ1]